MPTFLTSRMLANAADSTVAPNAGVMVTFVVSIALAVLVVWLLRRWLKS